MIFVLPKGWAPFARLVLLGAVVITTGPSSPWLNRPMVDVTPNRMAACGPKHPSAIAVPLPPHALPAWLRFTRELRTFRWGTGPAWAHLDGSRAPDVPIRTGG